MKLRAGVRLLFRVIHHSVLHYSSEKAISCREWLFYAVGSRATSRASGIALTR